MQLYENFLAEVWARNMQQRSW